MLAAIDVGKLFELVWAAALAGVVVAVTFSVAMVGFTRAADARREGSDAGATAYGALGLVAFTAFLGVVVYGVSVIIAK